MDANLSPKTKATLQKLVGGGSLDAKKTALGQMHPQDVDEYPSHDSSERPGLVRVEVPLRHNHEFFQILQYGLSGLNTLHEQEKTALGRDVNELGYMVSRAAIPSRHAQQTDMYAWRAIFELYLQCNVFFSTSENESFTRSPTEAQKQLQMFSTRLDTLQKVTRFRKKDSILALQRFLLINANLLRNLKFQQLNMRAAAKILKSR